MALSGLSLVSLPQSSLPQVCRRLQLPVQGSASSQLSLGPLRRLSSASAAVTTAFKGPTAGQLPRQGMTMVTHLQHRSMGCSDSSLAPRRRFSALPMANGCLCNTLAGTNLHDSSCYAVRQMLSTCGDSNSSSWNGPMPPIGSPASPHRLCVLCSLHCCIICLLLQKESAAAPVPSCRADGGMTGQACKLFLLDMHADRCRYLVAQLTLRPRLLIRSGAAPPHPVGLLQLELLPGLAPDAERDPQQPQCPATGRC